jgi:HSP20 family protein
MAIQKYSDGFVDHLPATFSTMLDRFFNDSLASRGRVTSFSPQVDAYEDEQGYQLEVALPGMKREEIKVDFHQGKLTISGERTFQNEQNQRRYHLVESSYGSFYRTFQLPDTVDSSRIEANFEDGVLRVSVPKDVQKTMRHQIEIRGGQSNQSNSQPQNQASNGQISGRMNQQATEANVEPDANHSSQLAEAARANTSA